MSASSLRLAAKSFAIAGNLSKSSISADGGETSGVSRYARFRAATSRSTRGLTSCRSITERQPATKKHKRHKKHKMVSDRRWGILEAIIDQFAYKTRIQRQKRTDRVAWREMILVAFVELDTIVLNRTR